MRRRGRPYKGFIACEYCGHRIGGSSKSGLFSNYNRHTLAGDHWTGLYLSQGGERCRCKVCREAQEANR